MIAPFETAQGVLGHLVWPMGMVHVLHLLTEVVLNVKARVAPSRRHLWIFCAATKVGKVRLIDD